MQNLLYRENSTSDHHLFTGGLPSVANAIAEYSNDDFRLYLGFQRLERVKKRLEKADVFLTYLEVEEKQERDIYKIHDRTCITAQIRKSFDVEQISVLKSAKRNT